MRITSVALGRFPGICFMPVELGTEHRAFLSSLHCGYVPDVKSICCTFMLPAPRSHIDVTPRTLLWLRNWLKHNSSVCSWVTVDCVVFFLDGASYISEVRRKLVFASALVLWHFPNISFCLWHLILLTSAPLAAGSSDWLQALVLRFPNFCRW